jgi:hypothetical protein
VLASGSNESEDDLEEQLESLLRLLTPDEADELGARMSAWMEGMPTIEQENLRRARPVGAREARARREEMKARARRDRGWEDDDPPF